MCPQNQMLSALTSLVHSGSICVLTGFSGNTLIIIIIIFNIDGFANRLCFSHSFPGLLFQLSPPYFIYSIFFKLHCLLLGLGEH